MLTLCTFVVFLWLNRLYNPANIYDITHTKLLQHLGIVYNISRIYITLSKSVPMTCGSPSHLAGRNLAYLSECEILIVTKVIFFGMHQTTSVLVLLQFLFVGISATGQSL